uniref:equilibrative nucleoside transporter 1 isoform X1 n=2 Tax=Ciona intestinalis TaxID=7719 RepID=UPI000052320F|nr:equilibrative nucleoside transporter 1 isoform X1 [Ciona intestinalis]|eukprot:XP_002123034.1 equilibrative nucleoside transporter 1 isoform X1 [Ciona intestinalis]
MNNERDPDFLESRNLLASDSPNSSTNPVSNQESIEMPQPVDRLNAVYFFFYMIGLGTLLPWNFFITANEYWMFKLQDKNSTNSTPIPQNFTSGNTTASPPGSTADYNSLQLLFQNALALCAMLPNVVFQLLNTVLQQRISEKTRMVTSLLIMNLCFVVTVVFVKIDTSSWQQLFFGLTMLIVVIVNCCSAICQSSVFGMAASLPPRYTQAVMAGQGMGGVFAALAMIATLSFSTGPTSSAFAFFLTAVIVLSLTLLCYIILAKNKFYRYHRGKTFRRNSTKNRSQKALVINENKPDHTRANVCVESDEDKPLSHNGTTVKPVPPMWIIFKKIWLHCFCVFFTFFVTLACFPAITVNIKSMSTGHLWNDVYFTPVCCFLMFNLTDWLGRSIAGYIHIPSEKSRIALLISVLIRGVFPALFALCNMQPRNAPVIFTNDAYYIVFMVLFGLSNGHLSTLCMQYGPKLVTSENAGTAGSMLAFSLCLGLASGAGFSFVLKMIIT